MKNLVLWSLTVFGSLLVGAAIFFGVAVLVADFEPWAEEGGGAPQCAPTQEYPARGWTDLTYERKLDICVQASTSGGHFVKGNFRCCMDLGPEWFESTETGECKQ
jgi:hypothetical protein